MKNGTHAPDDFADTVPMALHELPGALALVAAPRAAVAFVAPPRAHGPLRRATDAGIGLVARFSLHRRRSTDASRAVDAVAARAPLPPLPPAVPTPATLPPALQLFVRGFNDTEKKLLEGTVRLSQRRLPRLALVPEADVADADLMIIDGSDAEAVTWVEARPWLARKKTIWIDSQQPRPGHTESQRPVQWPLLPMLLARALEQTRGAQAQPTSPGFETPVATPPRASRVLVVDDSLAVRNHLRSLLEARGALVSQASCVSDALKALGAVGANHFQCALMDVLMPDMDGYEGCRRIKSLKASIGVLPVVMLTSKASPFDRIRAKMAGCDAYLTKPIAPALLYETLVPYLAPGPAQRPAATLPIASALRQLEPGVAAERGARSARS